MRPPRPDAARRRLADHQPFEFTLIGDIDAEPGVAGAARAALGAHGDLRGQVAYDKVPEMLSEAERAQKDINRVIREERSYSRFKSVKPKAIALSED